MELQRLGQLLLLLPLSLISANDWLSSADDWQELYIENFDIGYVLDVAHHYVPGTEVILYSPVHSLQQQFVILETDEGDYSKIFHPASGLYLQSLPGSDLLHVGKNTDSGRGLWKVIPHGEGLYVIQNGYSQKVLACFERFWPVDLGQAKTAGSVQLRDWVPDQKCQKWRLQMDD